MGARTIPAPTEAMVEEARARIERLAHTPEGRERLTRIMAQENAEIVWLRNLLHRRR